MYVNNDKLLRKKITILREPGESNNETFINNNR